MEEAYRTGGILDRTPPKPAKDSSSPAVKKEDIDLIVHISLLPYTLSSVVPVVYHAIVTILIDLSFFCFRPACCCSRYMNSRFLELGRRKYWQKTRETSQELFARLLLYSYDVDADTIIQPIEIIMCEATTLQTLITPCRP